MGCTSEQITDQGKQNRQQFGKKKSNQSWIALNVKLNVPEISVLQTENSATTSTEVVLHYANTCKVIEACVVTESDNADSR